MAAHKASLDIIQEAGIKNMRRKSIQLTGFLNDLIIEIDPEGKSIQVITPEDPQARGCQLSLFIPQHGQSLFDQLEQAGVVVDWREPNVIRAAPAPLYNTFAEVATFAGLLQKGLDTL
jgi:kynureninase